MLQTYIPVKKETRERLYDVKRGGVTWDALLLDMLCAYRAKQRADRRKKGVGRGRKAKGRLGQ